MSRDCIQLNNIRFRYDGANEPLFSGLTLHGAVGWTGIIGANGSGKSTLLKLATGMIEPDEGSIRGPGRRVYCAQRTDDPPLRIKAFMEDFGKEANVLREKLEVGADWLDRWGTLSHGERKRTQMAVALWAAPELLAVDEPFNHLDRQARDMIASALEEFKGVGLLVAHDRHILDRLCDQCVFLEPPAATIRPGGYTKAMEAVEAERAAIGRQRDVEKKRLKRYQKEADRRREAVDRSHARVSKGKVHQKDHDEKAKRGLAVFTGKDGIGGKLKNRMDSRVEHSRRALDRLKVRKEYSRGIRFGDGVSRRDLLFGIPAGVLFLGEYRKLMYPRLEMKPGDRVAVTGINGSGKSSLLKRIREALPLEEELLTHVPQEIDAAEGARVLTEVKKLPNEQLGFLMTMIRRLGSDPKQLLASVNPSPGEMRKLLLAMGLNRNPHLIIMDEPTNHMDLPSIRCLEEALGACACGLLLVSHERRFLDTLCATAWTIQRNEKAGQSIEEFQLHITTI